MFWHISDTIRAVPDSLKSVNSQTEFTHYSPNLIIFALIKFHMHPRVCILPFFDFHDIRTVFTTVHSDTSADTCQHLVIKHPSKDSHSVLSLNCEGRHL
jgi:hypothetical protein